MLDRIIAILTATLLYTIGGQFEVPIGPVPFILADFFVFLAALRPCGLNKLTLQLVF